MNHQENVRNCYQIDLSNGSTVYKYHDLIQYQGYSSQHILGFTLTNSEYGSDILILN